MTRIPGRDEFADTTVAELAFLFDYGFVISERSRDSVRFESPNVAVSALLSPFGEVEIRVARLGHENGYGTLTLAGMVGRASAPRVIQLLAEELRSEDEALRAKDDYFRDLAERQRRRNEELNDYYSARRSWPRKGKLPQ
jgi:hypothetical protein